MDIKLHFRGLQIVVYNTAEGAPSFMMLAFNFVSQFMAPFGV